MEIDKMCGACQHCKSVPIGDFRCGLDTTKRVWPLSTMQCEKCKLITSVDKKDYEI